MSFFNKAFFSKKSTLWGLFILIAIIAYLGKCLLENSISNNYLIYKGVFDHCFAQLPIYEHYPNEYFDRNHYGPFFSLIVAPFAILPHYLGTFFWLVSLCSLLAFAIEKLPISNKSKVFIFWFSALELLTSAQNMQFNIATIAMIVLTFNSIEKGKDFWAAFWIVIGTFVKLYGIVGLAFFFFSKNKWKFILSLFFWSMLAFVLPMLISSPEYIIEQYKEWFIALSEKNGSNTFSAWQNVSLLGLVRKFTACDTYSDLWLIIPAMISFACVYLRISQYKYLAYRLLVLSLTSLFLVLFSTGTESSTYIVAIIGVAIWYLTYPKKRSNWDLAILIFVFIFCCLSPTDLFPKMIREEYIRPYALKALPCVIVYIRILYELYFADFSKYENINHLSQ